MASLTSGIHDNHKRGRAPLIQKQVAGDWANWVETVTTHRGTIKGSMA